MNKPASLNLRRAHCHWQVRRPTLPQSHANSTSPFPAPSANAEEPALVGKRPTKIDVKMQTGTPEAQAAQNACAGERVGGGLRQTRD